MFDFMGTLHIYLPALSQDEIEQLINMYSEAIDAHDTICFEEINNPDFLLDGILYRYAKETGKKVISLDDPVKVGNKTREFLETIERLFGLNKEDLQDYTVSRAKSDMVNLVKNFGNWEKVTEESLDKGEEPPQEIAVFHDWFLKRDSDWVIPDGSLVIAGASHYKNLKKRMK